MTVNYKSPQIATNKVFSGSTSRIFLVFVEQSTNKVVCSWSTSWYGVWHCGLLQPMCCVIVVSYWFKWEESWTKTWEEWREQQVPTNQGGWERADGGRKMKKWFCICTPLWAYLGYFKPVRVWLEVDNSFDLRPPQSRLYGRTHRLNSKCTEVPRRVYTPVNMCARRPVIGF